MLGDLFSDIEINSITDHQRNNEEIKNKTSRLKGPLSLRHAARLSVRLAASGDFMREASFIGAVSLRKFDNLDRLGLELWFWLNDDWDCVKSGHFL